MLEGELRRIKKAPISKAILVIAIMKGLSSVAAQNPELLVVAKAVAGRCVKFFNNIVLFKQSPA